MIVNDGTIISSPLLKSNDFTATSSAVVPFVNATAYLRSNARAKELSNLKTSSLLPDILDLLEKIELTTCLWLIVWVQKLLS